MIAAITDRNFRSLVAAMDRSDLLQDPRYAEMGARERNWEDWQDIVAEWAATWEVDELERLLLARGVPCSRFRTVDEALRDEQLRIRGTLRTAEDDAGRFRYVGPPFRSSTYPPSDEPVPVPGLGQHKASFRPRRSAVERWSSPGARP